MTRKFTLLIIFFALLLLSACSVLNWEKRKYRPGFYLRTTKHLTTANSAASLKAPLEIEKQADHKQTVTVPIEIKGTLAQKGKVFINDKKEARTDTAKFDSLKIISLHPKVGKIIDKDEKIKYHLFPFFKTDDFLNAYFIQETDSTIFLIGNMKDGTSKKIPYTIQQFMDTHHDNFNVSRKENKPLTPPDPKEKAAALLALLLVIIGMCLIGLLLSYASLGILFGIKWMLAPTGLVTLIYGFIESRTIVKKHEVGSKYPGKGAALAAYILSGLTILGILFMALLYAFIFSF